MQTQSIIQFQIIMWSHANKTVVIIITFKVNFGILEKFLASLSLQSTSTRIQIHDLIQAIRQIKSCGLTWHLYLSVSSGLLQCTNGVSGF